MIVQVGAVLRIGVFEYGKLEGKVNAAAGSRYALKVRLKVPAVKYSLAVALR
jgi:hypothetical protein